MHTHIHVYTQAYMLYVHTHMLSCFNVYTCLYNMQTFTRNVHALFVCRTTLEQALVSHTFSRRFNTDGSHALIQ